MGLPVQKNVEDDVQVEEQSPAHLYFSLR
jgi:hypothetical protein